ncbi:peptidylprolyl isomerase [Sphingomonas sp.]|uniref:peptidylprolyl isomerase n=1 Tax=Sphingomonas sp. TaxID=28214 RepID=UPI002B74F890|nr:peptidylprolyl isomerase [Sphingomonas sp.]HWK36898.1 peptidylprolyl isomerase [Sphingomonas sp.]
MRIPLVLIALLALVAAPSVPGAAQTGKRPVPGLVRVRLVTSAGAIVVALDARRAPKTTANFLAYVDDGRFDGTDFYRAARKKVAPKFGFIQGGIRTDARRILPGSVPMERTDRTGIRHLDGTISMARGANPDSAAGNFSIMVGATPSLDAAGPYPGYAAFGHVVAGMDVVQRILAQPTGGGSGPMKGQMILKPVTLIRAERLDGTPRPTGRVKPWLIGAPKVDPPR